MAVYTYSLVLMLVCTGVMLKNEMFFNELGKVFVQQGGGVIFVIFFSNILNMLLIRVNDLDYLRGYSPTLSKLHFSAICLSCAWVCYRIGTYTSYLIGHNSFYGQAMMWGLSIIFEFMGICHLVHVIEKTPKIPMWFENALNVFLGEAAILMVIIIGVVWYREPFSWYDKDCTKKKVEELKKGEIKRGYYRNIKYEVSLDKGQYLVKVPGICVTIDKRNSVTKNVKGEIDSLSKDVSKHIGLDSDKVIGFLSDEAEKRKEILSNAHENVRKRYQMELLK